MNAPHPGLPQVRRRFAVPLPALPKRETYGGERQKERSRFFYTARCRDGRAEGFCNEPIAK